MFWSKEMENDNDFELKGCYRTINRLSSSYLKLLGIDNSIAEEKVETGEIKYYNPTFNRSGQIEFSLSDYLKLDKYIRLRMRKLKLIHVNISNNDILDYLDGEESNEN